MQSLHTNSDAFANNGNVDLSTLQSAPMDTRMNNDAGFNQDGHYNGLGDFLSHVVGDVAHVVGEDRASVDARRERRAERKAAHTQVKQTEADAKLAAAKADAAAAAALASTPAAGGGASPVKFIVIGVVGLIIVVGIVVAVKHMKKGATPAK